MTIKTKTTIDFNRFTLEEQEAYVEAWKDAGGTVEDFSCATPWGFPWLWAGTCTFDLDLPPDYGIDDIARAMLSKYPEAAEGYQGWISDEEDAEEEEGDQ